MRSQFNIFEIGKVYRPDKKSYSKESYSVVIASYSSDKKSSPFISLANETESLMRFLNLPYSFEKRNEEVQKLLLIKLGLFTPSRIHKY